MYRLSDAQRALQTVAQGQQAENLLDLDSDEVSGDTTSLGGGLSSGLAAMEITPAAKNIISGTSSNPLDDLVSIFGNSTPAMSSNVSSPVQQSQSSQFGGMGGFGDLGLSPTAPKPAGNASSPQQQQGQEEDLLGLF